MNRLLTIFGILLVLILSVASQAKVTNPMMRVCQASGGRVHVISIPAQNDEFLFCQFGDLALLDGGTLLGWASEKNKSLALESYQKTSSTNMNACYDLGGQIVAGSDLEGFKFLFCQFTDGSAIELSTLSNGMSSPANTELNNALNL